MRMRVAGLMSLFVLGLVNHVSADVVINGRLGPGALYRLVRPTNWNGSLLLYAHGYVPGSGPVALPAEADLFVSLLVPQGFAIAFSSYSENGWAVKDGAQRTHQLLGIFTSRFGSPTRVYIGGASMGGLITIELLERIPASLPGRCPPAPRPRAAGRNSTIWPTRAPCSTCSIRHAPGECRFGTGGDRYRDRDRAACCRRDPGQPNRCRCHRQHRPDAGSILESGATAQRPRDGSHWTCGIVQRSGLEASETQIFRQS